MAQTSDRVSTLASRYARYSLIQLSADAESDPSGLLRDIRSMAASLLRQDEAKGFRGLIPRFLKRASEQ